MGGQTGNLGWVTAQLRVARRDCLTVVTPLTDDFRQLADFIGVCPFARPGMVCAWRWRMTNPPNCHLVARALPNTLLFHDWTEALALWHMLVAIFPAAKALCLMPNHIHLITDDPKARKKLSRLMSGYARWRARYRGLRDAKCWERQPPTQIIADDKHLRRTVRYVMLNPCRGKLASDPLGWPLSNHRDLVGLGLAFYRRPDAESFHGYVTRDDTVSTEGSLLPFAGKGHAPVQDVFAAVSSILRTPPAKLTSRLAKWLLVHAAYTMENGDVEVLANELGQSKSGVYRRLTSKPTVQQKRVLDMVLRVIGDPRFPALEFGSHKNPIRWEGWAQGEPPVEPPVESRQSEWV